MVGVAEGVAAGDEVVAVLALLALACGCTCTWLGVTPPLARGGSAPLPAPVGKESAGALESTVSGDTWTASALLSSFTGFCPPREPFSAKPIAPRLATPRTARPTISPPRPPLFSTGGGGACGMPIGVGKATLPPAG